MIWSALLFILALSFVWIGNGFLAAIAVIASVIIYLNSDDDFFDDDDKRKYA